MCFIELYFDRFHELNFDKLWPKPESSKSKSRTIGAQQQNRDSREIEYLTQRITTILSSNSPTAIVDHLIEKVGEKQDEFVNAMAVIFPYEEFPFLMKDQAKSFYKKAITFSDSENRNESDLDEITDLRLG